MRFPAMCQRDAWLYPLLYPKFIKTGHKVIKCSSQCRIFINGADLLAPSVPALPDSLWSFRGFILTTGLLADEK